MRRKEAMLTMGEKKALIKEIQDRYKKATKKVKSKILDEFCATAGYNRVYAARILRLSVGKVIGYARASGKKIKYVIGKMYFTIQNCAKFQSKTVPLIIIN
jgi:hypothetical protein